MIDLKKLYPIFTLLFFGVGLYVIFENFDLLRKLSLGVLFETLFLSFLNYVLLGLVFQSILKARGVSCSFSSSFLAGVVNNVSSYFLPAKLNLVLKSLVLKRISNISIYDSARGAIDSIAVSCVVASLILLLFPIFYKGNWVDDLYTIDVILFFIFCIFVFFLVVGRVEVYFSKKYPGLLKNKISIKWVFICSVWFFLFIVMSSVRLFIFMNEFGGEGGAYVSVFLVSIACLATLFSVTPSGLFVKEGVFLFVASMVGISVNEMLVVVVLDRFVPIFAGLLLLAMFFVPLWKKLR
ncbi:MAG: flippase-like domain-containing protein [Cellvibrionaceae bacterium]